jgi:hypothetical protein
LTVYTKFLTPSQHALVLIRDNKKDQMTARFGFGEDINSIVQRFHFPLPFAADVFHVAIEKGLDRMALT